MPCFHPLFGYRSKTVGPSGKRAIVFSPREGFVDLPVTLPCGSCDGCLLERSRQWAVRCVHEASMHAANCFVTLTFSEAFLPPGGSLVKHRGRCDCDGLCRTFAGFMKRLRKEFAHEKIRYFHCGEYGDQLGRPHYHAAIFGFDFPDKVQWSVRKGLPVWRSPVLEVLWPFGQSELGTVTFESAAYVARYVLKKMTRYGRKRRYESLDCESGEVVVLEPEYTTMSRRPGIGASWFAKFGGEVFPADSIVLRGAEMKPPRFYFGRYELQDAAGALEVARERRRSRRLEDETPERLEVREKVTRARLARFERTL